MDLGLPSTTLPVAPIKHEMAAAYRLQRAVRRQQARDHGRRIRAIWPHINELRAKYVDNDVIIQAGRASEFYSDEAIVARESLRSHPAVLAALHEAWVACSSVNQSGGLQQGDGLDKNNFRSMARRVYLVSVLASAREPEVLTCNRALERDWKADVGGRSTLSREAFYESWFQLADLHTRSISPSAYATWIRNVTGRIVEEQGEEQQRAVRWRDCDKIILQQTGGVRRSRSCSTATRPVTRSSMDDVTVRRRVKSEGSSSATATPRDGWRLQHWLSAFKAEAEREVARGVAAPPAAAAPPPPLTRKRRLSSSTAARLLAPIQQRSQPTRPTPPAEPRAAATVSTAATALPPRRNSLAPLPSTQAAAPAKPPAQPPDATPLAPRTPTPPQSATGGALAAQAEAPLQAALARDKATVAVAAVAAVEASVSVVAAAAEATEAAVARVVGSARCYRQGARRAALARGRGRRQFVQPAAALVAHVVAALVPIGGQRRVRLRPRRVHWRELIGTAQLTSSA